jgi:hypothetical protein
LPSRQSTDLSSKVRIEVAHEEGEVLSVGYRDEKVVVVRHEDERVNLHRIASRGSSQDTEGQLSQSFARTEKIPPLYRAAGDLHECSTFRDKSKPSSHDTS